MERWHASPSTPNLVNFFPHEHHSGTSASRVSLAKETPHKREEDAKAGDDIQVDQGVQGRAESSTHHTVLSICKPSFKGFSLLNSNLVT